MYDDHHGPLDPGESGWKARPWYRAVVADGTPVGFVMVSWDAEPDPPEIIGPWFLWKQPGGPAGFYERLGFVPTGDVDENGEVIMRLALR